MKYDNTQYWLELHQQFQGNLRAVGWPHLSETFNELKYQSEAESLLSVFAEITADAAQNGDKVIKLLEIGVGIGYWTRLVKALLQDKGLQPELTCLDMSQEALNVVQEMDPSIHTVQADLKTIEPHRFEAAFDVVHALSVLHHLVNLKDFLNALTFAAKSVRPGGHLIIYDPVLTRPYSPFDTLDFASYTGNGMPRRILLLDDVLQQEGFARTQLLPGISFVLNSSIEGESRWHYKTSYFLWRVLCKLVHSQDASAKKWAPLLIRLDRWLKKSDMAYSSNICVYQKH